MNIDNANVFFNEIEALARETMGRKYKRYFKPEKSNLLKESKTKIKSCITKKHEKLFGDQFLNKWLWDYYNTLSCLVYEAVQSHPERSDWDANVYSDALLGVLVRHNKLKK